MSEFGFTFSRVVPHQVYWTMAGIAAHGLATQEYGTIRVDKLPSIPLLHLSIDHTNLLALKVRQTG